MPLDQATAACLTEAHMIDALLEEGNEVFVVDAIKDLFAVAACLNQAHLAQPAQVVRDGRFADSDRGRQGANIELLGGEGRQDAYAAGIAEGAKKFGYVRGGMFIENGGKVLIHVL